ncbi:transient receptor potential cation channel subfamily V member 5-like [Lineus longissimus]|uniref:transient receptor potential cation channel subfamily V member 5-like n=1 Tax=Lineus longissimus TaxID=88925 RepID=UPI00315C7798
MSRRQKREDKKKDFEVVHLDDLGESSPDAHDDQAGDENLCQNMLIYNKDIDDMLDDLDDDSGSDYGPVHTYNTTPHSSIYWQAQPASSRYTSYEQNYQDRIREHSSDDEFPGLRGMVASRVHDDDICADSASRPSSSTDDDNQSETRSSLDDHFVSIKRVRRPTSNADKKKKKKMAKPGDEPVPSVKFAAGSSPKTIDVVRSRQEPIPIPSSPTEPGKSYVSDDDRVGVPQAPLVPGVPLPPPPEPPAPGEPPPPPPPPPPQPSPPPSPLSPLPREPLPTLMGSHRPPTRRRDDEPLFPFRTMPSPPTQPGNVGFGEDDLVGIPSSPPPNQPMPVLMGTRAPMSAPAPISQHARGIHKSQKLSMIKALLEKGKKGAEEVFDILIRSVKLDKTDATMRILKALKQSKEDLCDAKYREKESTASLLHVALLYQRTYLCKMLIGQYPGLLKGKYTSDDYRNQTCFHIAAANDEYGEIIRFMLKNLPDTEVRRELLNTVADGSYFVEERPEAATCLSAAAWTGQVHMIGILVDAGADLHLRSIDGDTLLHFIIYLSTAGLNLQKAKACIQEVYTWCDVWWARYNNKTAQSRSAGQSDQMRFDGFCHLLSLRNDSGLIPVALAVSIHSPLTPFLLSFEPIYKRPQSKFGAVAWASYDVTDILSYKPDQGGTFKRYDCSSVFHILAHTKRVLARSDDDVKQKDIAELEPINSAIEMKWSVYRWLYILWCLIHATYMITLTTVVLDLHKNKPNESVTLSYQHPTTEAPINISTNFVVSNNDVNTALFGVFLVIPAFYVIFEVVDLLVCLLGFGVPNRSKSGLKRKNKDKRLVSYLINNCTITGNAPYRLLAFSFAFCMFTWYGMFSCGNASCDIPLSLALILGWIFMLNFTRACRHVCRFSIMIQKMFFRDFLYFITVYMFILIAFSSALHLVLSPGPSVGNTVMGLLNIVTNAGDAEGEGELTQKHYAAAVLSMYAILSVILLLNMLIAMMNTSYESVKSSKMNLWRYQQLSILLLLERRFIWWGWLCRKSQSETKRFTLPWSGGGQHQRVFLDVTEDKMKS